MDNAVKTILSKVDINKLPVVPKVLLDLIKATQGSNVSIKELAEIIGQDTSISSKVLASANSSFYRQWGEITDLSRVVVVLGISTVKTIAITRSVEQYFSQIPHINHDILELIWHRSLTCACIAQRLSKLTAYPFPEEAYLTGLLHRIGQLIMLECFPQEYPNFFKQYMDGEEGGLEKKLFTARHNEIGGALIESWNLQSFISDAVFYQYQPLEALTDVAHLVKLVGLAGRLSCLSPDNKAQVLAFAEKLFGFNEPLVDDLLQEVGESVRQAADEFGIKVAWSDNKGIQCQTPVPQRESIRKDLGERIKSFALSSAVRQQFEATPELKQLVGAVHKDLSALFGFQVAAFFLYRAEPNDLVGLSGYPRDDALWPSVAVSLVPDHSLLAKSLLQRRVLHSFDENAKNPKSIVDRQIGRLLGTEGLLVMPLYDDGQDIGVIAAGIQKHDLPALSEKSEFLALFSKEAGRALLQRVSGKNSEQRKIDEIRSGFQLQARKLVHETSNPLSIIRNYLYLLSEKINGHDIQEIQIIQDEIDRVDKLLTRFPGSLDNMQAEEPGVADINGVVADLGNLMRNGVLPSREVKVDFRLDKKIPSVSINKNKLKQILINLMKNAIEASPPGGKITVSTRDGIYFGAGEFIEIKVEDKGCGLPQEVLRTLYSPVASSKGKNHSGLGLTICKSLVDELKGIIRCDSSPTTGTVFYVYVPRVLAKQERKM